VLIRRLAPITALSFAIGCGAFEPKVHVYVDNGGAVAWEVSVDGATGVVVPAYGRSVLKLRPGRRRFVVRGQGQTVYDQSRDFPETGKVTKYVLNPDMTQRYTAASVNYAPSGPPRLHFDTGPGMALRATPLLKPDPWVKGGFDEVFDEVPPDSVRLKRGNVQATRMRLCRIKPEDYDRLTADQSAYLAAEQAKPAEAPHVGDETVAALRRVQDACAKPQ
jgi:hypothetical protein